VATKVVMRNSKLYVNRDEGFVGTSLKKDEFVSDCADIDDVIVFRSDGKMVVTKVDSKTFVGKNIIHAAVFKKKDKRTIYNMLYKDGKSGFTYMKRFSVTAITRDKEYDLTAGSKGSNVLYFTANPNGEAEVITINLRAVGLIKKLKWDIDLAELAIKGRASRGNIVTKYPIKKIEFKEKGVSTLKPRKIWFDETVQRLNVDERGDLIGEFTADDRLLIINQKGEAKTIIPNLNTHFESDMIVLEKWNPNKPISVVYFDGERERYYVKRFMIEHPDREEKFISEHAGSKLMIVAMDFRPMAEVIYSKRSLDNEIINFEDFIAVKGIKALGNQLTTEKIKDINLLEPLPYEEPVLEEVELVEEEIIEAPKNSNDGDSAAENDSDDDSDDDDDDDDDDIGEGQITLF
jgi:topoisomerase-4 subunit A